MNNKEYSYLSYNSTYDIATNREIKNGEVALKYFDVKNERLICEIRDPVIFKKITSLDEIKLFKAYRENTNFKVYERLGRERKFQIENTSDYRKYFTYRNYGIEGYLWTELNMRRRKGTSLEAREFMDRFGLSDFQTLEEAMEEERESGEDKVSTKELLNFFQEQTKRDGEEPESLGRKKQLYEEAIEELNNLVGLEEIKEELTSLIKHRRAELILEENGIEVEETNYHSLFLGNAGTGKTIVARLMGKILWALQIVDRDKFVEVSREDLIGANIGESDENLQRYLREARGGVFFLDEAYSLYVDKGSRDPGQNLLAAIIREMENNEHGTIFIFAGYEEDMLNLMSINQGFKSRIGKTYRFEDYTIQEIQEIVTRRLTRNGFTINDQEKELESFIHSMSVGDKVEGNAREARNIAQEIIQAKKERIAEGNEEDIGVIDKFDIRRALGDRGSEMNYRERYEENFERFQDLIGLETIKTQVSNWINELKVSQIRRQRGLPYERPSFHMSFEGNPGTGKTIVARKIGRLLKYSGFLSEGQFIEVGRSELVGQYQGHTSAKVKKIVEQAKGGVLFIDEAYSIVGDMRDSFGREAMSVLIQEMENNRNDLVVIFAGYKNEMEELFKTNPGINSRVRQRFHFPDYDAEELVDIFDSMIRERGYSINHAERNAVEDFISKMHQDDKIDGNGRWIRNIVEKILEKQSSRIVEEHEIMTDEELSLITMEDLQAYFEQEEEGYSIVNVAPEE